MPGRGCRHGVRLTLLLLLLLLLSLPVACRRTALRPLHPCINCDGQTQWPEI